MTDNVSIFSPDHFIQKKVIPNHTHISKNSLVSPNPNISLLAYRGVDFPRPIPNELRECSRVAVQLAVGIGDLVLGREMKNVHRLAGVDKVSIPTSFEMSI